jgi:hypothetical protein
MSLCTVPLILRRLERGKGSSDHRDVVGRLGKCAFPKVIDEFKIQKNTQV